MRLKFLCVNVWNGGILGEALLSFLREQQADVLALQEVYNSHDPSLESRYRCFDVVRDACGYSSAHISPAFIHEIPDVGSIEQGNAIYSRFPIKDSETIFYDVPFGPLTQNPERGFEYIPRNLEHVTLDVSGQDLHIYNTQGIWGYDGNDNPRRFAMAETIKEAIGDKKNIILAGDFNVDHESKSREIFGSNLQDVFGGRLQTSFNLRQKKSPQFAHAVVDMVFVGNGLSVVDSTCFDNDVSDHLPLSVTVEMSI